MGLSKIRIGDYIVQHKEKCGVPNLTCWDVSGVNKDKQFFVPSQQVGGNTSNYKVVPPNYFACNLMHVGRDVVLPIALNKTSENKVVSPAYTVFKLINEDVILRDFLFILINSSEKDRYFWFHCDSSVRDGMEWSSFCDLEFEIPDKTVQQKYVDIYDAMCENQKSYEKGLDDLKLTCDAYIDFAKNKNKSVPLSQIFEEVNLRNSENRIKNVLGIDINKQFMKTKASINSDDLAKYKEIKNNQFAFSGMQTGRDETVRIALYTDEAKAVISPAYTVYKVTNESFLPSFLMIWFNRHEFDRKGWFYSDGSVRANLDNDRFFEMTVPQLPLKEQQAIVEVYCSYLKRKEIADKFACSVKNICPILIKGAIEEGKSAKGR